MSETTYKPGDRVRDSLSGLVYRVRGVRGEFVQCCYDDDPTRLAISFAADNPRYIIESVTERVAMDGTSSKLPADGSAVNTEGVKRATEAVIETGAEGKRRVFLRKGQQ